MKTKHGPIKQIFATLVQIGPVTMRSSWFDSLAKAQEYAQTHYGVVAIEEIGKGVVFTYDRLP